MGDDRLIILSCDILKKMKFGEIIDKEPVGIRQSNQHEFLNIEFSKLPNSHI